MNRQIARDITHKEGLKVILNRMSRDKYDLQEITDIFFDLPSEVLESLIEDEMRKEVECEQSSPF